MSYVDIQFRNFRRVGRSVKCSTYETSHRILIPNWHRCESLVRIAKYYKDNDEMVLCALYGKMAQSIPYPVGWSLLSAGDMPLL